MDYLLFIDTGMCAGIYNECLVLASLDFLVISAIAAPMKRRDYCIGGLAFLFLVSAYLAKSSIFTCSKLGCLVEFSFMG